VKQNIASSMNKMPRAEGLGSANKVEGIRGIHGQGGATRQRLMMFGGSG
jgi:hypothetical protein